MPQENKERYTPGPWKATKGVSFQIVYVEQPEHKELALFTDEANAHLAAEAPAMFALLKEYMQERLSSKPDMICDCHLCVEARAIVARVLGEAE